MPETGISRNQVQQEQLNRQKQNDKQNQKQRTAHGSGSGAPLFFERSLQCKGELIGTGGSASAAVITLQETDRLGSLPAFQKFPDGFEVAVTAADKPEVMDFSYQVLLCGLVLTGTE